MHRYDVLGEFMEYIARNPVVGEVPAVLVAYLGILTSLASGPKGAQVLPKEPLSGDCQRLHYQALGFRISWKCRVQWFWFAGHVSAAEGGQHLQHHLMEVLV